MTIEPILRMIESVSPDDSKALDEIDARVWCYLNEYLFHHMAYGTPYYTASSVGRYCREEYTRSRDALKAIRPENWTFDIYNTVQNGSNCEGQYMKEDDIVIYRMSPRLKTEELVELHAILQAIAYERNNTKEKM